MLKFFTFKGRLPRWNYFKYTLAATAICLSLLVIPCILLYMTVTSDTFTWMIGLLPLLVFLEILFLSCIFALTIRRLHDIDCPGIVSLLLLTGVGQLMVAVLWFVSGTPGDNKYGPDPLLEKK